MFYTIELLSSRRNGQFAIPWLVAICGIKKVKKNDIIQINVELLTDELSKIITTTSMRPKNRLSLRISAHLLHGLVLLHAKQIDLLFDQIFQSLCTIRKPLIFEMDPEEIIPEIRKHKPRKNVESPIDVITMEDIARMDLRAITLDEEPIPPVPAQVPISFGDGEPIQVVPSISTRPMAEIGRDITHIERIFPSLNIQDNIGAVPQSILVEKPLQTDAQSRVITPHITEIEPISTIPSAIEQPLPRPVIMQRHEIGTVLIKKTKRERKMRDTIYKPSISLPYLLDRLSTNFSTEDYLPTRMPRAELGVQPLQPSFPILTITEVQGKTLEPVPIVVDVIEARGGPIEVPFKEQKPEAVEDDDNIRILKIVKDWNFNERHLTIEDLSRLPINRRNIAKCFQILLELCKKAYLILHDKEGTLELDRITKGPRFP